VTVDGEYLEQLWSLAGTRPATATFRTAALDVHTTRGPVLVAVDKKGGRALLVPIATKHTLRQDIDGHAVVLRRRMLEDDCSYSSFASLELVDPRLGEIFTALCVEIAERITTAPDRPVAALRKVLDDWRSLLATKREVLTPSALAGLFGELYLLREMVGRDPGAVAFWTGPTGTAQDFHRDIHAMEVKTTASPEGRTAQIHGVDQLDVAPPGRLILHWSRLRTDRGVSVPDLVDDIRGIADDVSRLEQLLRDIGYLEPDREIYDRRRFEMTESRTYLVGPGFPRITAAALVGDAVVGGVGPVDYVVDLDSPAAQARCVSVDPISAFLEAP
jgi:hypothetical protein